MTLAAVSLLAGAGAPIAQACIGPDGVHYYCNDCFSGEGRATPSGQLTISSFITPLRQSSLSCSQPTAGSGWVMFAGSTNYIQVGYAADCGYGSTNLFYFEEDQGESNPLNNCGTGCSDRQLGQWPSDGGHTFKITRSSSTYSVYIDGTVHWTITVPGAASNEQIYAEGGYANSSVPCDRFAFNYQSSTWNAGPWATDPSMFLDLFGQWNAGDIYDATSHCPPTCSLAGGSPSAAPLHGYRPLLR